MATRRDSGRKGGLTTLRRHGKAKLTEWGRRGGRPRNPDYDEVRQQQSLRNKQEVKQEGPPGGANLSSLQRLWRLRSRSSSDQIAPAGIANENPTEAVPARKEAR
jgi:hypothetical protein